MVEITKEEEVARSYRAALDSCDLLNAGKPEDMNETEWQDCKQRNIDHLKLQLEKGAEFYGEHDLTPFTAAIAK